MKEELGFLDIFKLLFANKYLMKNKYAWNQPPQLLFHSYPYVCNDELLQCSCREVRKEGLKRWKHTILIS